MRAPLSIPVALYMVTLIAWQDCSGADLTSQQNTIRKRILNQVCCVPNLSSGYTPYKLKNGSYKETVDNSQNEITLQMVTFGVLEKKPVATALLDQCSGGSGVFYSLLLYELRNGNPIEVGSYAVGDRADVRSISIRSDGVQIIGRGFHGDRSSVKLTTLRVKRKDFDVAECITHLVSAAERKALNDLKTIWIRGYEKHKLTDEDKQAALDIVRRHRQDRKAFAEDFRLSLETDDYGSTKHPLVFDKDGKPVFHIDNLWKKIYLTVPLTVPLQKQPSL
jgi:hypothetical protein